MTSTGESPLLLYCACTGHLGSPSLFPSAGSVARLSGVSPPLSLSLSLSLSLCGPRTPPRRLSSSGRSLETLLTLLCSSANPCPLGRSRCPRRKLI